ncbi:MAG: pyridoxal phosphate-dependent aminotransferase [Pseudomonas sp.]|nr:pyridoxal phosphate-dependent aminotransferase [Pseudomonas sp.]
MDDLTLIGRVEPFREASAYAASSGALNLSQGLPEPLFDNAMNEALARQVGASWQYADPRGEMILRESIAAHSAGYEPSSEVLVTSGCTEALYLALYAASMQYGNRVAFFEPFYPYYPGMATLLGLEFVALPLSMGGSVGPDWVMLEQQLRAGIRILLLNTPHNPTGWCMSAEDWQRMVALAKNHDFMVIVDEAYRYYQYDTPAPASYPHQHIPMMVAGSASKLLSMTGVRIGWLCAHATFLKRAYSHHLYLSYCQPVPLQAAVAVLLDQLTIGRLDSLREHYKQKRDRLAGALMNAGLDIQLPAGGHYVMADYSRRAPSLSPVEFSQHLAVRCGVMPLPATPFYLGQCPTYVRFSFSVAKSIVDQACARLEDF